MAGDNLCCTPPQNKYSDPKDGGCGKCSCNYQIYPLGRPLWPPSPRICGLLGFLAPPLSLHVWNVKVKTFDVVRDDRGGVSASSAAMQRCTRRDQNLQKGIPQQTHLLRVQTKVHFIMQLYIDTWPPNCDMHLNGVLRSSQGEKCNHSVCWICVRVSDCFRSRPIFNI